MSKVTGIRRALRAALGGQTGMLPAGKPARLASARRMEVAADKKRAVLHPGASDEAAVGGEIDRLEKARRRMFPSASRTNNAAPVSAVKVRGNEMADGSTSAIRADRARRATDLEARAKAVGLAPAERRKLLEAAATLRKSMFD